MLHFENYHCFDKYANITIYSSVLCQLMLTGKIIHCAAPDTGKYKAKDHWVDVCEDPEWVDTKECETVILLQDLLCYLLLSLLES